MFSEQEIFCETGLQVSFISLYQCRKIKHSFRTLSFERKSNVPSCWSYGNAFASYRSRGLGLSLQSIKLDTELSNAYYRCNIALKEATAVWPASAMTRIWASKNRYTFSLIHQRKTQILIFFLQLMRER